MMSDLLRKNGHGGRRKGAGRKRGSLSPQALERLAIRREFDRRTLAVAHDLHNAQYVLAVGSYSVFRLDNSKSRCGTGLKRRLVPVTSPEELQIVIDEHGLNEGSYENGIYFIVHNKPDNRAIESMLNRAFGKPRILSATDEPDYASAARLFAAFRLALTNPVRSIDEQIDDAIEAYCRIKGIDYATFVALCESESIGAIRQTALRSD